MRKQKQKILLVWSIFAYEGKANCGDIKTVVHKYHFRLFPPFPHCLRFLFFLSFFCSFVSLSGPILTVSPGYLTPLSLFGLLCKNFSLLVIISCVIEH